jgi:hypothetical protein
MATRAVRRIPILLNLSQVQIQAAEETHVGTSVVSFHHELGYFAGKGMRGQQVIHRACLWESSVDD